MRIDTHRCSAKETAAAIGITGATLSRWTKDPHFPQPLRLSKRTVRYDLEAVKQYLSELAA